MKFVEPRPFADPDFAARKLVEIASTIEPAQNGRIYIELVNAPFLKAGGRRSAAKRGIDLAILYIFESVERHVTRAKLLLGWAGRHGE